MGPKINFYKLLTLQEKSWRVIVDNRSDSAIKTIPLFSSRLLNIESYPGNCCKDWEGDNYKVEHKELLFRRDFTEKRGIFVACK